MAVFLQEVSNATATNIEPDGSQGEIPLSLAAKNGHEAVVLLLLQNSRNIGSGNNFASTISDDDNTETWSASESESSLSGDCRTPLPWAAENGHKGVVRLLLESGANIEQEDEKLWRIPLNWVAKYGQERGWVLEKMVQLLIGTGADIESKDENGRTPLFWASMKGSQAMVQLLLEKGVDFESKDQEADCTPLLVAAGNGHTDSEQLILGKGAEIEAKNNYGQTSLSEAAKMGIRRY
ncbi:ankyrin repeat-containing domain protein [Talaromyces proteolyticus]|uniref:Ankyrin repeat-containing domain protein n=1 Tax=Talaromyces proteolyticus TaxID=1131652 RepID=A0AAD4KTR3_9EURO|nr:ankyrin repeat-containing domain protein [Talaromyces proteolyticus]KAH8699092.1 ankyrin repeat-containing domain protein [Talaromyces proteolyticus]